MKGLKKKSAAPKDLRAIEEQLESNTGFDPEDPPPSLDNNPKPPWGDGIQTDHRRF